VVWATAIAHDRLLETIQIVLGEIKMTQTTNDYGIRKHLNLPYEQAIEKVTAALKEEGFGVLTEIDVKATLKKKLDVDFRRYVILGACNPVLANQALNEELEIGLLLPCNVIVYDDEQGGSVVSIIDPISMLGIVENPNLDAIADEARARLQRVGDTLETTA
jgi:uncharacterized protein (DUF302 family)